MPKFIIREMRVSRVTCAIEADSEEEAQAAFLEGLEGQSIEEEVVETYGLSTVIADTLTVS